MNKLHTVVYPVISMLALAAAVAAHAESPTFDVPAAQPGAVTKTRAQVRAELDQARADGSIKLLQSNYDPMVFVQAPAVVAPHLAMPRAARIAGVPRAADYAAAMYGEDSGSFYLSAQKPARDASQMLAGAATRAQR